MQTLPFPILKLQFIILDGNIFDLGALSPEGRAEDEGAYSC